MRAKAVCQVCPVVGECRAYALQIREPYGIWGGLTETERRRFVAAESEAVGMVGSGTTSIGI